MAAEKTIRVDRVAGLLAHARRPRRPSLRVTAVLLMVSTPLFGAAD